MKHLRAINLLGWSARQYLTISFSLARLRIDDFGERCHRDQGESGDYAAGGAVIGDAGTRRHHFCLPGNFTIKGGQHLFDSGAAAKLGHTKSHLGRPDRGRRP